MKFLKIVGIIFLITILMSLVSFFGTDFFMKKFVGKGNEVLVPNIENQHFDVARKKMKKLGLYVQSTSQRHDNEVKKGYIISQNPHPDIYTKKNRSINVVVSLGPEMIKVPYLDNITEKEAFLRLQNAGLSLGEKEYQYSDNVRKGKIINSQPLADYEVPRGSKVNIVVSIGSLPHKQKEESSKWKNILED